MLPARLTAADEATRDLAAAMAGRDALETAERFCAYVHGALAYAHAETSVATTAAEGSLAAAG